MVKLVSACAFLLVVMACTTDEGGNPRSTAGNKYVNTAIGTTLQFPPAWQLKTDYKFGEKTFDLAALAPPVSDFSANVLVSIEPHQGTDDMREVLNMIKQSLTAQTPDLREYRDTVYKVDGTEVGEVVYTTGVSGKDYRAKSVFFVNRNKEVSIIYTDLADRYTANADFASIQASMEID